MIADEVTKALDLLGSTPDEVAQSLHNKGCLARYCKSYPWPKASNCPVAVYLKDQFPEFNFSVSGVMICLWPPNRDIDPPTICTPVAVGNFIRSFDNDLYPFLYAPEGE